MNKKKLVFVMALSLVVSATAYSVTDYLSAANSIGLKVQGMFVGSFDGTKCTGWQTVFQNPGASTSDFTQSLDIGQGTVDQGSKNCVALLVDNNLSVTANSNAGGACAGWTGQHIFAPGLVNSGQTASDLDGNVIAHDTDTPSSLYLFFRVGGTGDVFNPSGGGALNQAITIGSGTTTLSFKFQASAGHSITDLQDDSGTCTFADPNVGFSVSQD
jgi:hypothetical protein